MRYAPLLQDLFLDSRDALPQIIHPFYIFQIASIVLWSLDDYYYYAFCIALISVISIVTTLIDTKKVKSSIPCGE